jgi:hypothetical protein
VRRRCHVSSRQRPPRTKWPEAVPDQYVATPQQLIKATRVEYCATIIGRGGVAPAKQSLTVIAGHRIALERAVSSLVKLNCTPCHLIVAHAIWLYFLCFMVAHPQVRIFGYTAELRWCGLTACVCGKSPTQTNEITITIDTAVVFTGVKFGKNLACLSIQFAASTNRRFESIKLRRILPLLFSTRQ